MAVNWQFRDADEDGVAVLSLPVDRQGAAEILRGKWSKPLPSATVEVAGRPADVMATGWPGLYVVSRRLVNQLGDLSGALPLPLQVSDLTNAAEMFLLGALGVCEVGPRDSQPTEHVGRFPRFRGVAATDVADDFAVPRDRDMMLVSDAAATRLSSLANALLTRLEDVTFIP